MYLISGSQNQFMSTSRVQNNHKKCKYVTINKQFGKPVYRNPNVQERFKSDHPPPPPQRGNTLKETGDKGKKAQVSAVEIPRSNRVLNTKQKIL